MLVLAECVRTDVADTITTMALENFDAKITDRKFLGITLQMQIDDAAADNG